MPVLLAAHFMVAAAAATPVGPEVNSGNVPSMEAQVVASGATVMQGANGLQIDGSIAQPDISVQTGPAGWRLEGGFWRVQSAIHDRLFTDGFEISSL